MKRKHIILIVSVLACLILGFWIAQMKSDSSKQLQLSEAEAISMVKEQYPELKDYPSNTLPPRSVRTEQAEAGWYVAFIQEGSGRPIISARCYLVNREVSGNGSYEPQAGPDDVKRFSIRLCKAE